MNYIEILKLCTRTDNHESRLWMQSPFHAFGRTFATNGYIMVTVPMVGIYPDFTEKVAKAYPFQKSMRVSIPLEKIKIELAKYPVEMVYDELDCDECNGSGSVTWTYNEYEKDDDCPLCEGHGYFRHPTDKTQINEDSLFKIGVAVYRVGVIEKLIQVAELAGYDSIYLVNQGEKDAAIFEIGEIEMLIMPMQTEEKTTIGEVRL